MGKNNKDNLGDRMKSYETPEAGRRAMRFLPVCVRLDGQNFSKALKNVTRPFSPEFHAVMKHVARELMAQSGAVLAYTQSDEISLILYSEEIGHEHYFGGKYQKLASILAARASAEFAAVARNIEGICGDSLVFDCRAWTVPNVSEAMNTIVWREMDATKNSVSMLARHYFSHSELQDKGRADMLDMLISKGINWSKFPSGFKRGTYILRVEGEATSFDYELPRAHPLYVNMPPITTVENRTELLRGPLSILECTNFRDRARVYDTVIEENTHETDN